MNDVKGDVKRVDWGEISERRPIGAMTVLEFDRHVATYRMCQEVLGHLRSAGQPKGLMVLFDRIGSKPIRMEGLGAEVFLEELRRCLTMRYCESAAALQVETLAVGGDQAPSSVLGERRVR